VSALSSGSGIGQYRAAHHPGQAPDDIHRTRARPPVDMWTRIQENLNSTALLATVIDCHTRMVIGWAAGDNYKTPLIEKAIAMAARNFQLGQDAIFRSDRGSNYTSGQFPGPCGATGSGSPSAAPGSAISTGCRNRSTTSTWNSSSQRESTINPLSGRLGADHRG
jgi:hypothetical protein